MFERIIAARYPRVACPFGYEPHLAVPKEDEKIRFRVL
jgi:hypothetical protein